MFTVSSPLFAFDLSISDHQHHHCHRLHISISDAHNCPFSPKSDQRKPRRENSIHRRESQFPLAQLQSLSMWLYIAASVKASAWSPKANMFVPTSIAQSCNRTDSTQAHMHCLSQSLYSSSASSTLLLLLSRTRSAICLLFLSFSPTAERQLKL